MRRYIKPALFILGYLFALLLFLYSPFVTVGLVIFIGCSQILLRKPRTSIIMKVLRAGVVTITVLMIYNEMLGLALRTYTSYEIESKFAEQRSCIEGKWYIYFVDDTQVPFIGYTVRKAEGGRPDTMTYIEITKRLPLLALPASKRVIYCGK